MTLMCDVRSESLKVKRELYRRVVLQTKTCGTETWGMEKGDKYKVNVI